MRSAFLCVSILCLAASGCSTFSKPKNNLLVYAAGDKATVGSLIYTVTDTQVAQQLGDNPVTARTPQERFYLVRVSVSNAGSDPQPIPAMALIDDAGKTYSELTDGTNVPNWLGIVRDVDPAQTEQGVVLFDAPRSHYRLRLNDPLDGRPVAIDVPLDFVHERVGNIGTEQPSAPAGSTLPAK